MYKKIKIFFSTLAFTVALGGLAAETSTENNKAATARKERNQRLQAMTPAQREAYHARVMKRSKMSPDELKAYNKRLKERGIKFAEEKRDAAKAEEYTIDEKMHLKHQVQHPGSLPGDVRGTSYNRAAEARKDRIAKRAAMSPEGLKAYKKRLQERSIRSAEEEREAQRVEEREVDKRMLEQNS